MTTSLLGRRIYQMNEEEQEAEVDYGDLSAYSAPAEGLKAFLQQGGISQEDLRSIRFAEGNRMVEDEREEQELLPAQADADIDLDEQLTSIQRRDNINRLKMLALMGLTYHHVTTGESLASVFKRDAPAEKDIRLNMRDTE